MAAKFNEKIAKKAAATKSAEVVSFSQDGKHYKVAVKVDGKQATIVVSCSPSGKTSPETYFVEDIGKIVKGTFKGRVVPAQ